MKAAKLHPAHYPPPVTTNIEEESTTLTEIKHGPKNQPNNNRRRRHENFGAIYFLVLTFIIVSEWRFSLMDDWF